MHRGAAVERGQFSVHRELFHDPTPPTYLATRFFVPTDDSSGTTTSSSPRESAGFLPAPEGQPIAAEDWPAVVVWLGCAFSGRRRESASEYRRFPRRSADVAHPTPSSPTIQQTSNRFRGLSRQPPPGKKRRLDFPASTVGGRPGGRNFCEMIVNVSESHGNI